MERPPVHGFLYLVTADARREAHYRLSIVATPNPEQIALVLATLSDVTLARVVLTLTDPALAGLLLLPPFRR